MKKPKLDWDRVRDENLIKKRGAEYLNKKRDLESISKVICGYCGNKLEDNRQKTELIHLQKCQTYLKQSEREYEYRRSQFAVFLASLKKKGNFPYCALGRFIKTEYFIGKAVEISDDKKIIKLRNYLGETKSFEISALLRS